MPTCGKRRYFFCQTEPEIGSNKQKISQLVKMYVKFEHKKRKKNKNFVDKYSLLICTMI